MTIMAFTCPDAISPSALQVYLEEAQKAGAKVTCPLYQDLLEYLESADRTATYVVQEVLQSGTVVTHKESCSYEQMARYVKAIFLPSHPPPLVISTVLAPH